MNHIKGTLPLTVIASMLESNLSKITKTPNFGGLRGPNTGVSENKKHWV